MMSVDDLKIPPHSLEAEQSVLGGLMLDNAAWDIVADRITEQDFYRKDHRLIFNALSQLAHNDREVDVVTVSEGLASLGVLEEAGGIAYLGSLVKNTPGSANIQAYADIIRERSVLRQLVTISNEIANAAFNTEGRSSDLILDEAESKIFEIAEEKQKGSSPQEIRPLLAATMDRISDLFESDDPLTGLTTGYKDIDESTAGLQAGDLIIIAGRPSMGKTAFAMNLAENAVMLGKPDKPVVVFSMEMPAESLVMRMLSSMGRINQTRIRSGRLEEEDWSRLTSTIALLQEKNLFIDDTPALSPGDIRTRARRIARDYSEGLGLIVIDYLQLMQVPGAENRVNEISEISRSLKALAKELDVPIIALSQLNRGLEQRQDKRPMMADLRESGAIEQDADVIIFIYRDEVYDKENPEVQGLAEIIIGKQRNGPIGTIKMSFRGEFTRFEDLAPASYGEIM